MNTRVEMHGTWKYHFLTGSDESTARWTALGRKTVRDSEDYGDLDGDSDWGLDGGLFTLKKRLYFLFPIGLFVLIYEILLKYYTELYCTVHINTIKGMSEY